MRTWVFNAILIFAMVSQQLGYLFNYFGIADPDCQGLWYKFNGLTHVLLAMCIYAIHVNWLDEFSSWTKPLTKYLLIFTINQFVDEMWNVATKTQANEWFVLGIVVAHAYLKGIGIKHIKCRRLIIKI